MTEATKHELERLAQEATATTRAQALAVEGAELSLSGRCVGRLEFIEGYGTTFRIFWHAPEGCEHENR